MEELKIIDPLHDIRWDKFVSEHPYGWIVHLSGWKKVIESTFPHIRGYHLALIDQQTGTVKAGLPIYEIRSWLTGNRLVSIPFATISDLLVSNEKQSDLLINETIQLLKRLKLSYIEIRTLSSETLRNDNEFHSNSDYKYHYLNLTEGIDAIWKNLSAKSVRYEINKAKKNKIELKIADNEEDLKSFYRIYALTRKRLGLPAQPYLFFKTLYNTFSTSGNVAILLAVLEGKTIASHLLFKFNGRVSAEAAGDDPDFRNISPSRFLFWEGIKAACMEGYKVYDFGRTSIYNNSLMDFKKRWGTHETDIYTFFYEKEEKSVGATSRETSLSYRIMRYICQNSPDSIQPIISRFCYRHLG